VRINIFITPLLLVSLFSSATQDYDLTR